MSLTTAFTIIVILIATLALVLYDIWTYLEHGYETTISYHVLSDSMDNPIIAALIGLVTGILFGHFFWPQCR